MAASQYICNFLTGLNFAWLAREIIIQNAENLFDFMNSILRNLQKWKVFKWAVSHNLSLMESREPTDENKEYFSVLDNGINLLVEYQGKMEAEFRSDILQTRTEIKDIRDGLSQRQVSLEENQANTKAKFEPDILQVKKEIITINKIISSLEARIKRDLHSNIDELGLQIREIQDKIR